MSLRKHAAALVGALLGVLFAIAPAGAEITYYHNDLAGSPVVATNEAGTVIWRQSYRPYGDRLTNPAAATGNKMWFTSRHQEPSTGLVYMGARYYDPVVGRFMSTDPVGFDEKNLHSHNRYAYANNNPYKYIDPDGRAGVLATTAAGAGAGSVAFPGIGTIVGGVVGFSVGVWGTWQIANHILNQQDANASRGDKDPSTPTGRKGNPIDVKPGTNEPTSIGGRVYTGHGLDQMQGRGVPPSAVEDAIKNGRQSAGNEPRTTAHAGDNGVTVITGDRGQVITVIPK